MKKIIALVIFIFVGCCGYCVDEENHACHSTPYPGCTEPGCDIMESSIAD